MKIVALAILVLAVLAGSAFAQVPTPLSSPPASAWVLERPRSSIQIKGFKDGRPFTVTYQKWNAELAFDPGNPALSRAVVTIDTRSGSLGEATYKEYLVTPSWFDPDQVPYAQFQMTSFSRLNDTIYQANGILNLYNQPKTFIMPFPGIGIPFQAKFIKRKNKPEQAEFVSDFSFAVPDFTASDNPATALKRPPKKLNFVMTLKAVKVEDKIHKPAGK